jgi:hypothetical protein
MPSETLTGCKMPPNTKAPLPMTRLQSAKKYKMGGMGRNSKKGIPPFSMREVSSSCCGAAFIQKTQAFHQRS